MPKYTKHAQNAYPNTNLELETKRICFSTSLLNCTMMFFHDLRYLQRHGPYLPTRDHLGGKLSYGIRVSRYEHRFWSPVLMGLYGTKKSMQSSGQTFKEAIWTTTPNLIKENVEQNYYISSLCSSFCVCKCFASYRFLFYPWNRISSIETESNTISRLGFEGLLRSPLP